MHIVVRNCNHAFYTLVSQVYRGELPLVESPSRYGDVIRIDDPVIVTYTHPRERVLFNPARDCNPFFHLFESLWMLAGRNDLEPIVYYNSKMSEFSDDGGKTQPAAYGYRWRTYFGWDQLKAVRDELMKDKTSRRVVLGMWDPKGTDLSPLAPVPSDGDFQRAIKGSKDVPCNTHAYFDIQHGRLVMTVCNRSNDMVWGMLGANVVHFSFLQEYLARCIGVEVGEYHQFTNNLHVYKNNWFPEKWLDGYFERDQHSQEITEYANGREDKTVNGGVMASEILLATSPSTFDVEVKEFVNSNELACNNQWLDPFLNIVAKPMCRAFMFHKQRHYDKALETVATVQADDWREAGTQWLRRRKFNYESKLAKEVR